MREYLLGMLAPGEAAAFEDRYFADDALFEELKRAEDALVSEYLDNRLSTVDRKRFELRYLQVRELTLKLAQARAARSTGARRPPVWALWAAGAAACLLLAAGAMRYWKAERREPVLVAGAAVRSDVAAIEIDLAPYLQKSGGSRSNRLPSPPPGTPVRLRLQLPDRKEPVEVTIRLIALEGRKVLWQTTQAVLSGYVPGTGQTVAVVLPPGLLAPADYLIEAVGRGGSVVESYFLHVTGLR